MFQGVPGASDTSVNLPRKGKREKKTPGETMDHSPRSRLQGYARERCSDFCLRGREIRVE